MEAAPQAATGERWALRDKGAERDYNTPRHRHGQTRKAGVRQLCSLPSTRQLAFSMPGDGLLHQH